MINGNESIFPDDKENPQFNSVLYGLSKREHFSAMAMQGLLASMTEVAATGGWDQETELKAQYSVKVADALIKALNDN